MLERPDHRLHVVEIHGLVVVVEIDPAGLASDGLFPFARIGHHRCPARIIELLDAEVGDRHPTRHFELLLGLHLRGKAVTIPTEAAVDLVAPHRLIAGDNIFHIAGQQVAMMRQSVGERWAVVEHELIVLALINRALEGTGLFPTIENLGLNSWEVGFVDGWIGLIRGTRHSRQGYVVVGGFRSDTASNRQVQVHLGNRGSDVVGREAHFSPLC